MNSETGSMKARFAKKRQAYRESLGCTTEREMKLKETENVVFNGIMSMIERDGHRLDTIECNYYFGSDIIHIDDINELLERLQTRFMQPELDFGFDADCDDNDCRKVTFSIKM